MQHFTLTELSRSSVARMRHIDNTPPPEAVKALHALVDNLLDPLRDAIGSPLTVTSGYRCPELNAAVGGAPRSHHLRGMAADVTAGSRSANMRLWQLLRASGLPFTQAIDEQGYAWIHLSYDPADLRRQMLHL